MTKNYKLRKSKETKIRVNILLKQEIPVYQRPRSDLRLPAELERTIKSITGERDEIIRSSVSGYAGPITLSCQKEKS